MTDFSAVLAGCFGGAIAIFILTGNARLSALSAVIAFGFTCILIAISSGFHK